MEVRGHWHHGPAEVSARLLPRLITKHSVDERVPFGVPFFLGAPGRRMTEFTILMPCLNEAATVGNCVAKARGFLARAEITGEVLVVDNGSRDGSRAVAEQAGARIAEVPTALQPDGRGRPSHLRSWRDGWRHLRFLLLFSPRWLFLYPGLALLALGMALTTALYFAPLHFLGAGLDIHSMLYASAGALLGMQLCLFALFGCVSAQNSGLLPRRPGLDRLLATVTLERGLLLGLLVTVTGLLWSAAAFWQWREAGFGALDPRVVMRDTIPAAALMIGGMEIMLASFLLSLLTWKSGSPNA